MLRNLNPTDVELVYGLFSDKKTIQYTDYRPHISISESKKFIQQRINEANKKTAFLWGIFSENNAELIGIVRLYHIDYYHKFAATGGLIKSNHRRQGIITAAYKFVLKFVFNELLLHRLEAQVFTKNIASCRLLEKLGFRQEAMLRENFLINNKFESSFMYSILEEEYIRNESIHP